MIDRARLEVFAYTAFRIVIGLLFTCHGMQKLFGLLGGHALPVGSQLWIGGVIEFACGLAVALGLFTRPAAFLACGTMAVAYIQFHWKLAFDDLRFLPIVNDGEAAVFYCFAFLAIFARGAGPISIDRQLGRSIAP